MATTQKLFDPEESKKWLEKALKKSKDGDKRPFAFGVGKSGAFLVLDQENKYSCEKFKTEIKKTEFKDKYAVGTATVEGKIITLTIEDKKGSIKQKEIKEFLAGVKTQVARAVIVGAGDEEDAGEKSASA